METRRVINIVYSVLARPYAKFPMLMLAAALEDELETAKMLCRDLKRIQSDKLKICQAVRKEQPVYFLRTGVGPEKSAERLKRAIGLVKPSSVLVIGYAGALDPGLRLGSLVAVERATEFSLDPEQPDWDHVRVGGEFDLCSCASLVQAGESAGLNVRSGGALTSSHVLGDPAHKRLLYEKFHALIVDMETAALARIAQAEAVPLSCIRAVSDEAADSFLAPFSHDPSAGLAVRARRLIDTGMIETYREWKLHSLVAKESLRRFLCHYF